MGHKKSKKLKHLQVEKITLVDPTNPNVQHELIPENGNLVVYQLDTIRTYLGVFSITNTENPPIEVPEEGEPNA